MGGDPDALSSLNERMSIFYSCQSGRRTYQDMLSAVDEEPAPGDSDVQALRHICSLGENNILEVGCAHGRLYRQLRSCGFNGKYSGIEVSEYLIKENACRHPEAGWTCGTVYALPYIEGTFGLCFSFYVLEHLVYPKLALTEIMRVIKPGGRLVLVFPDFVESGRLGSQQLGFSIADTASEKLRKGRILDALVSLYDSRIRLPIALRNIRARVGDFPVNLNPACLHYPKPMLHDMDAVYIASKREVCDWAEANRYRVEYPFGVEGKFELYAFMVISK